MFNKESIFNLMREHGHNPRYSKGSSTLIETDSIGIYYVLSYSGTGRIGWGASENILKELKEYPKSAVLFINSTEGEMYILLDNQDDFWSEKTLKEGVYKIDKCEVIDYCISYENFDEYLRTA